MLLATLSGCASFDELLTTLRGQQSVAPAPVPLQEREQLEPLLNHHYLLEDGQTVIGEPQIVFATEADTLADFARTYGLGYDEILAANPDVDPWLPGEGTPILLPTQYVLPAVERRGIVLNIAAKRLYYFPEMPEGHAPIVKTYPIGIGRVGWETPIGKTVVTAKARDPHWYVPASVRREHAEMGDPLPSVVPPGPDNPLGHRVLKLDMPGYLIHGTNQPFGVGMRVSHGCVRLYPENIELLYELVDIGEPVEIINAPYLLGERDGELFFEAHEPLEDDLVAPEDRLQSLLDSFTTPAGVPLAGADREHAMALATMQSGVPAMLARQDSAEVYARARVVRNVIEVDPDAPTLSEVRDMIDEAVEEASVAEAEAL